MSRPVLETIERTDQDWLTKLNSNFEKLFDVPFPFAVVADLPTLTSTFNAKKYSGCMAVASGTLYRSTGAIWEELREQLDFVADLNPGTVILSDIVTAYNDLLSDMQTKGWMAP